VAVQIIEGASFAVEAVGCMPRFVWRQRFPVKVSCSDLRRSRSSVGSSGGCPTMWLSISRPLKLPSLTGFYYVRRIALRRGLPSSNSFRSAQMRRCLGEHDATQLDAPC